MIIARTLFVVFAGACLLASAATSAHATDTTASCTAPLIQLATGHDGTAPRVTVQCTGGASSAPITYFSYEIKTNPTVAQLIERTVYGFVAENGPSFGMIVLFNDKDLSGAAWGCGNANCRIIDYVYGF